MIITKFQPDQENMIHCKNVIRILLIGKDGGAPAIWAACDPLNKGGASLNFTVKRTGERVDIGDVKNYIASLIIDNNEFHIFGEDPKIIQPQMQPPGRPLA